MKKVLILILAVILSLSVFAMAACQQPCETHIDTNHDGICDVCETTGLTVTHTDTNHDGQCDGGCGASVEVKHVDAAHDGQCDVCLKSVVITHVDANNDGQCDVCEVLIDHDHADANADGKCDVPTCKYEFPWLANLASAKEYVNSMYLLGAEVTAADYSVATVVSIGGVRYSVDWEIQSEVEGQTAVVLGAIDENTKYQLVDVDIMSPAEVAYKLVATISDPEGHSVTVEYARKVPVGFKMSEVHPYVGAIYQGTLGKTLYLDGTAGTRYLNMTEDATKAVSVYAESATGGFKFYILDGETKKYITIYTNSDGKTAVNYDAAGETIFAYNPSTNCFFTTFGSGEVYLGTYSTYNTVSVSATSYITPENTGVSQFPLEMLPVADGATYAAFITQAQQGKVVYVTGEVSGRYLATSESEAQAVVIYAEKVAGGYKFYKLNGETKEYITIYANGEGKDSVNFDAAGETVFTYDPVVNAWVANFNDKDKYLGTYSSYTTVSVSNLSYITAENTGVSQFPLEFKPVAGGSNVPVHTCESKCEVCGKCLDSACTEEACASKCEGHQPVAGPVVGKAYIMSVVQGNLGKTLYFNGQTREADGYPWYFKTSENKDDAVHVFVEETTGGFYLYFMNGETKTYIRLYERSAGSASLELLTTAPAEVYTWDETYATLKLTVGENSYYIGTYGTYNTLSGSSYSKIVGSFPCAYTAVEGSVVPPVEEHKCENVCPTCGKCTNEDCAESVCAEKCEGHEVVEASQVVLTVTSLGLKSDSYAAGTVTVSGSTFEFVQLGNYGNGIQMRDKNGNTSLLWNTVAFSKPIARIELVYSSTQAVTYSNANAVIFSFGNAADSLTYSTKLSTTAGQKTYTITPDAETYTFFKLEHDLGYTFYWDSITIVFAEGEAPAHTCESVCPECGKCLDTACTETACASKCEGHVPPHACESVCPECGKCTNEDCAEAVCADKCEGHTPAVVLEDVAVNVSELVAGQLAANTELVAGSGIYATTPSKDDGSKLVIDSSKKSIDGFDFTLRLKFGGTMKVADGVVTDGLKLEVKGAATITVYAMSSSSGSDRVLQLATLADGAFTTVGEQTALGASIVKLTYEVSAAGTYYLGSTNSGINVYYVAIAYQAQVQEPAAVVINGKEYSEAQAQEALLALQPGDVVTILANATIAQEYTFVAANYTIGEGAVLVAQANMVAPAGAKLTVSANAKFVVEAGVQIDISALTQEDFATSTQARLEIAEGATVIMPAYTEQLWKDAYLKAVIEAMVADSDIGAKLVLGETKLTKTADGWEAEAPAFDGITSIAEALEAKDGVAVQLTGRVTGYYNGYKSNFYLQDENGKSILVYYSTADANLGDIVTVTGTLGSFNGTKQVAKGSTFIVVEAHVCSTYTEATCLEAAKCTICAKAKGDALGHTEPNAQGKCDRCGEALASTGKVATFTFGSNSSAAHVDGNDLGASKTYTDGAYSLKLTLSKVYGPAYDAKGNSCIKLGTSKVIGSISFTVPEDVTKVVIYVAQYKANSTKVNVNGTDYTISTSSNNGAYTAIEIDTTTTKTVTLKTVASTYRCMIDGIEFWAE